MIFDRNIQIKQQVSPVKRIETTPHPFFFFLMVHELYGLLYINAFHPFLIMSGTEKTAKGSNLEKFWTSQSLNFNIRVEAIGFNSRKNPFKSQRLDFFCTVVGGYINTTKTIFLFNFLLLSSIFQIINLLTNKKKLLLTVF